MKPDYYQFKSSLSKLEKLQAFKQPFTEYFNNLAYSNNEETNDHNSEYFLLTDFNQEEYIDKWASEIQSVDVELTFLSLKMAKLLTIIEQRHKNIVKNY